MAFAILCGPHFCVLLCWEGADAAVWGHFSSPLETLMRDGDTAQEPAESQGGKEGGKGVP